MTNEHEFDQPAAYCIIIKGVLDSSWEDWFDGFCITTHGDETFLNGCVVDQSALYGILSKLNDLGLSIIAMIKIP